MRAFNPVLATLCGALAVASGCGPIVDGADDAEAGDTEAVSSSELRTCYCPQPYTCGFSSSPSRMYSGAHAAMLRAGVGDGSLIQTFGDASASVGTHCPEPGATYSAATDIDPGGSPCARVHNLRMQGFAAFYRVPPSFGYHIHMVYAGTPSLKSSLRNQIDSFLRGHNGLASDGYETHCAITAEEKAAVRAVLNGNAPPSSGGSSSGSGSCVPGGSYCGGDKVSGNASTLYRCGSDGKSATVIRSCSHGCSVNPGRDDSCRCVAGSAYCGGDVVSGNSSTLYRCGSDGVSVSVIRSCANGCRVNPGNDDSCN
ncbi:MAG: hypothetical protein K1X89_13060 [Myxococcaceae bacterium]|nr:hypothetical protein [Myxococcaceae bacterium]